MIDSTLKRYNEVIQAKTDNIINLQRILAATNKSNHFDVKLLETKLKNERESLRNVLTDKIWIHRIEEENKELKMLYC